MLEKGPKQHNKTILQIIGALLRNIDFKCSKLFDEQLGIFAPILNFLQGDLWPQAMAVMEVIFIRSHPSSVTPIHQDQLPQIRERILQCQEISDCWNQLDQGKAVVFSALAKVMQSTEESGDQLAAHKEKMKNICETLRAPRANEEVKSRKKRKKVSKVHSGRRRSKTKKSVINPTSKSARSANQVLREPKSRSKDGSESATCDGTEHIPDADLQREEDLEHERALEAEVFKVMEHESAPEPPKDDSAPDAGITNENVTVITEEEISTQTELLDGCPFLKSPAPSIKDEDFQDIQAQALKIEDSKVAAAQNELTEPLEGEHS